MGSQLAKRTTSKRMSRPNRDRALGRIHRELRNIVNNSPMVREARDDGRTSEADVLASSALDAYSLLVRQIVSLWPR